MKNCKSLLITLLLVLSASSTYADIYIGAGVYYSAIDESVSGIDVDEDDYVPALFVGWKPIDFLAVEAGYYDLGEYNSSDSLLGKAKADISAWTLGVSGILPVWLIDLYAKVGYSYVDYDLKAAGMKDNDDDYDPYYGVGANINITDLIDIYAEYIRFDTTVDVDMVGLGVRLQF